MADEGNESTPVISSDGLHTNAPSSLLIVKTNGSAGQVSISGRNSSSQPITSSIRSSFVQSGPPSRWWHCFPCIRRHHHQAYDERASHAQGASLTAAEVHDATKFRKQIAKYSTMRVHMKRVQLCLEQEKRNRFYKELVVYILFLSVIMASLISLPIHYPYEQNAAIDDLFFDEEFPDLSIRKSFHDVMTEAELWQWVEGPLLNGYYDLPIRNNKRIGSIQVRTGRMKEMKCHEMPDKRNFALFLEETCYPDYTPLLEDTTPYGNKKSTIGQQYTWEGNLQKLLRSQIFNPSLLSRDMDFGTGGYVVYLPRDNRTAADEIVEQLKEDFLSDASRYFVVSFSFYNARSSIFTFVQALFELSETDYMEKTARVKSFHLLPEMDDPEFIYDNLFVLLLIFVIIWLTYIEVADISEYGFSLYLHSYWNFLDLSQLVLLVWFVKTWVVYIFRSGERRSALLDVASRSCSGPANNQEQARNCYVNVEDLSWEYQSINNCAAVLALVSVAIIFKYLRLNTRLNLLWRTLRFASKDLLAFVVIFFMIFFAFAVVGFLIFGSNVRSYHSLSGSLISCFQMLLGAFDFQLIYEANPTMATTFFFSFMISVYLICVNMFIAIMSEYYSLAQQEQKQHLENRRTLSGTDESSKNKDDFTDSLQFTDVEYDLAKQIKDYIRGLQLRVRLAPVFGRQKAAKQRKAAKQLFIRGHEIVLLVSYDYLVAERHRLRTKFRGIVHLIVTVYRLMRIMRGKRFHMVKEREYLEDGRLRRYGSSLHEFINDGTIFPIKYLPVNSKTGHTAEILNCVRDGMLIEMDDGSLTKDQVTLEVIGKQDSYVPQFYRDYISDPLDSGLEGTAGRLSVATNGEARRFGLTGKHEGIGDGEHIRVCRVIYDGDTVLEGLEGCILPTSAWIQYLGKFELWGMIRKFWQKKKNKHSKARLVTDAEIEKLISESCATPGRGISCRFDELVRNFRMVVAKKNHKRADRWRKNVPDFENRIFGEVICFLERFPSALAPLDKRELEGYKYDPTPVDVSRVRLPNSINLLAELLSQNAHEVWAIGRISQGWRWGKIRDTDNKLHPDLVPYELLSEQDKQYDRDTSIAALKVITALGYILEPPADNDTLHIQFGQPAETPGGTYTPKCINTEKVRLPSHLKTLVELLAENTHEVWAKMRMDQGWKYGTARNDITKEHNGLVPYMYLSPEEKEMDRNTAMQTVKVILRCGFSFLTKDQVNNHHRMFKNGRKTSSSSSIKKIFGRNENPTAKNMNDAVIITAATQRARRAFLRKSQHSYTPSNRSRGFSSMTSSGESFGESSAPPSLDSARDMNYNSRERRSLSTSSGFPSNNSMPSVAEGSFSSSGRIENAFTSGSRLESSNSLPPDYEMGTSIGENEQFVGEMQSNTTDKSRLKKKFDRTFSLPAITTGIIEEEEETKSNNTS